MDPVKWDLQNGISAQWAPDKVGHTADGDITDDPGDGYDTSNKDTINEKLVQSGVGAIVQPAGSIRDKEIINFANETDTVLIFSKTRHFRH